jgi:hypothetical protein
LTGRLATESTTTSSTTVVAGVLPEFEASSSTATPVYALAAGAGAGAALVALLVVFVVAARRRRTGRRPISTPESPEKIQDFASFWDTGNSTDEATQGPRGLAFHQESDELPGTAPATESHLTPMDPLSSFEA